LIVWEWRERKRLLVLTGAVQEEAFDFRPGTSQVIVGSPDGAIRLLDLPNDQDRGSATEAIFRGRTVRPASPVAADVLLFAPDGHRGPGAPRASRPLRPPPPQRNRRPQ